MPVLQGGHGGWHNVLGPQAAIPRPKAEQCEGYPVLRPILKTPSPPNYKAKGERGPCWPKGRTKADQEIWGSWV